MKKMMSLGLVALAVAVGVTACGGEVVSDDDNIGAVCSTVADLADAVSGPTDILFQEGAGGGEVQSVWDDVESSFRGFREEVLLRTFELYDDVDITDDVTTYGEAIDGFSNLMRDSSYEVATVIATAASDPEALELFEIFDDPEVEAAADRIEAYAEVECEVDLALDLDGEN